MPMLADTVAALSKAEVNTDIIKSFDSLENALVEQANACNLGEFPRSLFSIAEMAFTIERSLPRKCPSSPEVLEALETQLLHDYRDVMEAVEQCKCKPKARAKAKG